MKKTCSQLSSECNEHLYGTAPRVDHWFLLEYPENWGKDVIKNNIIPDSVKQYLSGLLNSYENSRIQFIKKNNIFDGYLDFYYAISSESDPKLYKFRLNNYEDLLDIDLQRLAEFGEIGNFESDEKVVIVCTHGTYDSCCGRYGVKVYNEIKDEESFSVWNSTHVGAHRFATNLVMLPEGIYYGRVDLNNIKNLLSSHMNYEIYLDCFRGRSCYSQVSQVSDYFLRKQINKTGIYDIRWEFEKDRDMYTSVEFGVDSEGLVYSVNSIVLNDALKIFTSCGDTEIKKIPQFYFYSLIPYVPKNKQVKEE